MFSPRNVHHQAKGNEDQACFCLLIHFTIFHLPLYITFFRESLALLLTTNRQSLAFGQDLSLRRWRECSRCAACILWIRDSVVAHKLLSLFRQTVPQVLTQIGMKEKEEEKEDEREKKGHFSCHAHTRQINGEFPVFSLLFFFHFSGTKNIP